MAVCPACFGEGCHDLRSMDARIVETWDKELIDFAVSQGMVKWAGIVECDECEGTGVVSEERRAEMLAVSRARVDQILAKFFADNG